MTTPPDPEELERLRIEVEDLRGRLEAGDERRRPGRLRRVIAVALVALAIVTVPVATTAVWARRTIVNEDAFVDTVGPLPREPAVQVALSDYLTAQIMGAIDVEELVTRALPERGGRLLAAPLADAVEGFVHEKVTEVVSSERFADLWEEAARRAQRAALAVLRGDTPNLRTEDGDVILDLVPAISTALEAINESSPQILGRDVTLPDVTSVELPEEARERIERAIGRPLPDQFGSLVVFQADQLGAAQDAFQTIQRALILLVLVALACVAGAVALSPARRRTILQLALGIAFGVVLVRRLGLRVQAEVLDLIEVPTNRAAAEVVSDRLLSGFFAITTGVLVGCAVVAVVALLTGPYRWAVALRRGTVALGRSLLDMVQPGDRDPADAWIEDHGQLLQVGAVVVAMAVLLLFDLSWWGVVLLVVVTAAFVARMSRVARPGDTDEGATPPG